MMPSLSLSSSSSSVSATIRVHKATSELLVGPDWALNMEICDVCNSNHWLAKDVLKEVKRRVLHKNSKVQLLTLTLLETMVKNCGEYIHSQISERKLLDEMIKIVKKKGDYHVREKILMLLDSWQEAFGGPGGRYSQYYWACDELRRFGAHFPQRSQSTPIITPPATQLSIVPHVGSGMPANSSRRLDEAMTSEVESLSFSTLESMRNVLELLDDMLQAVNPDDRAAVKDEVIVDLVESCRSNQKKLMQMITTTTDEELLARGLELNDSLQSVLAKHDAIASGSPLPNHQKTLSIRQVESNGSTSKTSEPKNKQPVSNGKASAPAEPSTQNEEEEEEDEFALLARRHSKTSSAPSHSVNSDAASSSGSTSNALVLIDAPEPAPAPAAASSTQEQDLIDLLSIVLTTSSTPTDTTPAPNPVPADNAFEDSFNNYVVPWAQPQPQQPLQPMSQYQAQYQPMQPQLQPQLQPQPQQGYTQYPSGYYPPPPWEANSGYVNNQNMGSNPYMYPTPQGNVNGASPVPLQGFWSSQNGNSFQNAQYGNQPMYSTPQSPVQPSSPVHGVRSLQHSNSFQNPSTLNGNPYLTSQASMSPSSGLMQGARSLQHVNSFPARNGGGMAMNGNTNTLVNNGSNGVSVGQKPFVPSYRLFEDLNVLGSSEGKLKNGPYPSASGNPSQNMVAGRR